MLVSLGCVQSFHSKHSTKKKKANQETNEPITIKPTTTLGRFNI